MDLDKINKLIESTIPYTLQDRDPGYGDTGYGSRITYKVPTIWMNIDTDDCFYLSEISTGGTATWESIADLDTYIESVEHNQLAGLQGGTTDEYYHLASSEYTEINDFFNATDITGAEAETLTDGSDADSLHTHSAFIDHDLANAENDFLVASGDNAFVKKTLAETGAILETDINHNNLQGIVSNEHINHTSVTLTAGDGLTGGGDISANRSFFVNVDTSTIEINTDTLRVKDSGITYTKIQNVSATDKLLGRATAGAGTVEEITCTPFARSILDDVDEATFKATINLEIGTDVLAQQTIGIANDNLLEVDDADAAENDYAKFTVNGLAGRSYSEVLTDLSGQAGEAFDWNSQNLTSMGNIGAGVNELTIGSINRASGTLTLEIGGSAKQSITSTETTLSGNFVIPDAGYIGSDSDADAIQIEADGDVVLSQELHVAGNVGIGTTEPGEKLDVSGNIYLSSTDTSFIYVKDSEGTKRDLLAMSGNGATSLRAYSTNNLSVHTYNGNVKIYSSTGSGNVILQEAGGNVGIGTTNPNQLLTIEDSISLKEIADANTDTAAYGQIWVHDTTPNELWFTDDAGTDTQISSHPMDAPPELYQNRPGQDWIGKRKYKLLGIIQWQTLNGTITEETFEEYNTRRAGIKGHKDLVKIDYNEWLADQQEKWKEQWIKENITEIVVEVGEAVVTYEVDEIIEKEVIKFDEEGNEVITKEKEIEQVDKITNVKYVLDEITGMLEAKEEVEDRIIYKTKKVTKFKIGHGYRIDEETGKCYKTVVPTDKEAEVAAQIGFDEGLPQWIKDRIIEE